MRCETSTHSNWLLMDYCSLVTHKAMTDAVCEEIVCFLVACLCHTSSSISVPPDVKCSLSQLPITSHWTQTRNAASTWFSPNWQREMKKKGEWIGSTWWQGWSQSFIWILTVTIPSHHWRCCKGKVWHFWKLFSFLLRVIWQDWYRSHVWTINMKLQPVTS